MKIDRGGKVKGEGKAFYSAEEVIIAYNEKQIDLHANIKVKADVRNSDGTFKGSSSATVGRDLQPVCTEERGFINALLTKKALREIIGDIIKWTKVPANGQIPG